MSDLPKCRFCGLPIIMIDGYWIVTDSDTTADGLSYCPPDPDMAEDVTPGWHQPPCDHGPWVAGFMVVHPEDLAAVAAVRKVVCGKCDQEYDPKSHR